jgi:hypothetical protein
MRRAFFAIVFICSIISELFGQDWVSVGPGMSRSVSSLYVDHITDKLWAGGLFDSIGSLHTKGIATWDGSSWSSVGSGAYATNCNIPSIIRFGNNMYATGNYFNDNNHYAGFWNGTTWDTLPFRYPGPMLFLTQFNGYLILGGNFDSIGHLHTSNVALFDGNSCYAIGLGTQSPFGGGRTLCAAIYHNNLYVGGEFADSTDSPCNLLKWTGSHWVKVGGRNIMGGSAQVEALCVYNNELYIGGSFITTDGNSGNNIMKWNDTVWSPVGSGMDQQVISLLTYDGKLYAGGGFSSAGGQPANHIAVWNDTIWASLGSNQPFNNNILCMAVYHNELYVGGGFTTINGQPFMNIAKYAHSVGIEELKAYNTVSIFPNPGSGMFTLRISDKNISKIDYKVFDISGRLITERANVHVSNSKIELNLSELESGIYFCTIQAGEAVYSSKIILQK